MSGAYEDLNLNAEHAIDMGTMMYLKTHKKGEGAVKPRRHIFIPKVGKEEPMMDLLMRYVGGKKC